LIWGFQFCLLSIIILGKFDPTWFFYWFALVALTGLLMVYISDTAARRKAGSRKTDDSIYDIRQSRTIRLLQDIDQAFESCVEVVNSLNLGKIRRLDKENYLIETRTRPNWESPGSIAMFSLHRLGDNLTEVHLNLRPRLRTVMLNYGESWQKAELIERELRDNDTRIGKNALVEGAEVLLKAPIMPLDLKHAKATEKTR
jgi:hypothetical protein